MKDNKSILTKIRGYFLTGIIVTAPVGLTFYVSFLFIGFIDAKVRNIIPVQYHYDNILPFEIPGLGLLFVFIMLTFIGFLTAGLIGRYIIKLGERIIARLPIIRSVYGALKQIFESVLKTSSKSFREVVLIEYPRKGIWAVGFATKENSGEISKKTNDDFNTEIRKMLLLCQEDIESTNTLILEKLDSNVPLVKEIASYLVLSGGKRLRPLLTSCSYHLLTNHLDKNKKHIGLAAAVEFIHAATLLHDDVVDLSKDRRGNLTANEVWGNKTSVLVGDFLFSRSFQLMTKYGTMETLKILSDTSVTISEGEVLEISNDKNLEMNEDTYFQVINGKTASLFSAACQVGGISGGAKENEHYALKSFGTNFGMAFQLIDDAIDYSSNSITMGKNTGDDFKEGKITLPLILAFGRSSKKEKQFLQKVISKPKDDATNFSKTKELLIKYKCIEDTLIRANHFADVAIDSLGIFNDNEYKSALIKLIETSIKRLA